MQKEEWIVVNQRWIEYEKRNNTQEFWSSEEGAEPEQGEKNKEVEGGPETRVIQEKRRTMSGRRERGGKGGT